MDSLHGGLSKMSKGEFYEIFKVVWRWGLTQSNTLSDWRKAGFNITIQISSSASHDSLNGLQ
jgi:hypothetical protein